MAAFNQSDSTDATCPQLANNWQVDVHAARFLNAQTSAVTSVVRHPLQVLFLVSTQTGSAIFRGMSAAVALKQKWLTCKTVSASPSSSLAGFDVVVHVKFPCEQALAVTGVVHVHDHVDRFEIPWPPQPRRTRFTGEIFNTHEHMHDRCTARVCVVIPHKFNLRDTCAPRSAAEACRRLSKPTLTVGTIGMHMHEATSKLVLAPHVLLHESRTPRAHALRASRVVLDASCAFLQQLDVAIAAYHPPDPLFIDHDVLKYKPAERLQNPVILGLPTIGARGYAGNLAQVPRELTCGINDLLCPLRIISRLRSPSLGGLASSVHAQVRCVLATQRSLPGLYANLFEKVHVVMNHLHPTLMNKSHTRGDR